MLLTTLEQKARKFQALIEEVFRDEKGLIRGSVEQATRRPWNPEYFDSTRDVLKAPGLPPPNVMWAYEQTNMCQGFYLLSLVYQYEVTRSSQALDLARRTFEAIWQIYQMAPPEERGFLTKPYGGNPSRETHADQYFPVFFALEAYNQVASTEGKTRIVEMVMRFADWWMRQQYKLIYFGIPISINRRTRLNLLPLFGLAYQFSGENKYRDELLYQFKEIAPTLRLFGETSSPTRIRSPFGRYCGWFLATDYLIENGYMTKDFGQVLLREYWRAALATVSNTGMCHVNVEYDPETDRFYLPKTGYYRQSPLFEDSINWDFVYWNGRLKTAFGTAGLGMAGTIIQRWLPQLNTIGAARTALESIEEKHLASYVDDEGGQLDAKHRWLAEDFRSDAIALWLCAYWAGRYHGFWV